MTIFTNIQYQVCEENSINYEFLYSWIVKNANFYTISGPTLQDFARGLLLYLKLRKYTSLFKIEGF